MRLAAVVLALSALVGGCHGAPAADEVTSLPGWEGELPSKMFSGFIDTPVGHVHYMFVEAEVDPTTAPVVLWVQGGPGGSSMEGMWTENVGPFQLNGDSMATTPPTLYRSSASWTSVANMLFWEAPAGVGFSYCDGDENGGACPHWNDTTSAVDDAAFLCGWFEAFPEFKSNEFFMTGESYAGVYIPTTALELLKNDTCAEPVNLKGVAIGNGCTGTSAGTCSPQRATFTFKKLAEQTFLSQRTVSTVNEACADSAGFTRANEECQSALLAASDEAGPFNNYNVHDDCAPPDSSDTFASFLCGEVDPTPEWACRHAGMKGSSETDQEMLRSRRFEGPGARLYRHQSQGGHRRHGKRGSDQGTWPEAYPCGGSDAMAAYLSDSSVQEALHVTQAGLDNWPGSGISYSRTAPNLLESPGYPDLIAAVRVLIYSGDFDAQIPHVGTEEWTRGLAYPEKASWHPWYLANGQPAGHVTEYDVPTEFTFLTIAAAGHMAPTFRPAESLAMISRFLNESAY